MIESLVHIHKYYKTYIYICRGLNPTYIKSIIKNDQKLTLVSYKKRDKLMCINDACFSIKHGGNDIMNSVPNYKSSKTEVIRDLFDIDIPMIDLNEQQIKDERVVDVECYNIIVECREFVLYKFVTRTN